MNYACRDARAKRAAILIGFSATIAAEAAISPCSPLLPAAALAGLVGIGCSYALSGYFLWLDYLARELEHRRRRQMAALAIDD